jgi:hypothetical protein
MCRGSEDSVMPVVVAAVLTMSAAQMFDLATFWTMVHRLGPGSEVNPLVGALFAMHGYPFVAAAKVAMLALVTAIGTILIRRERSARLAAVVIAVGTLIGPAGGISNSVAIGALPLV